TDPVTDLNGDFSGVIAFEVDLAPVYKLVNEAIGLGSTGETALAKKEGNKAVYLNPLRFAPEAALNKKITLGEKIALPVQEAVQGKTGAGLSTDYRGKQVISAWTYIPSLGWGLVAKIDSEEAFADVLYLQKFVTIVVSIVIVLFFFLSFAIARSISEPIKRLTKGTEIIGSGNLDHQIEIGSKDEIGQLSRSFDKMTRDLKKVTASRDELNTEIGERKKAEIALQNSSRRFELLSQTANKLLQTKEPGNLVDELCRKVMEYLDCQVFFNFLVDEKSGRLHLNAWGGIPEEEAKKIRWLDYGTAVCGCVARDGCPIVTEHIFQTPDPRTDLVKSYGVRAYACHPLLGEGGKIIGTLSFGTRKRDTFSEDDLSLMKAVADQVAVAMIRIENEESLRQTTNYLESLFNYANAPIICWDAGFKITRFNHAFENLTKYGSDEVIGNDLSMLFPDDSKEESLKKIRHTLSGEHWEGVEIPILKKGGDIRMVLWNSANVYDADGKILIATIAQGQDITERKEIEEALRASETSYRIIANNTYDFEFWINPEGKYIYASPSCEKVTGYSSREFLKNPSLNTEIIYPEDRVLFDHHRQDVEKRKAGELEFRIKRKDGSLCWISHACQPVYDEKGVFLGTRGGDRDITNRKNAEDLLKRVNENLEQFAYVASHDLQEPLRVMASYSQLLERRYKNKLDQDADEFINFIVDAAKRMQTLISDLLTYSRIGRTDLSLAKIDCNEVLKKVLYSMNPVIKENSASIDSDQLPTLMANESNFIQLFQNFIGNAIKFRGKDAPSIHISAKRTNSGWEFSVSDNGIGIDEKYQEKVFVIFQRLHARDEYPGTGIGLSICKKIVENYGGKIWLVSELGKGSTFFFTIPANTKKEEADEQRKLLERDRDTVG
ncbi:MAG: PAS domain S-box protein, partial [Candidatus Omnitrophica bacterium]|nr:PAS domain S-box protein [Candidatus Omnitrophota bacterium]